MAESYKTFASSSFAGGGLSAAIRQTIQKELDAAKSENRAKGLELLVVLANIRFNAEDREEARRIAVDVLDLPANTAYGPATRAFIKLDAEKMTEKLNDMFERMLDQTEDPEEEEENKDDDFDPYDGNIDPEERFQRQPAWLRRVSGSGRKKRVFTKKLPKLRYGKRKQRKSKRKSKKRSLRK